MSRATSPRGALLEIDGLTVAFPGGEPLVLGASLRILPGQVVTLLGPSGAGKTTLLRALLGPSSLRHAGYGVVARAHHVRVESAFVPQRGALFDHLDVGANIRLAEAAAGAAHAPEAWLRAVELDPALATSGRPVSALSGGQAQRVAVARTLAAGRRLVVLDEPSVGLDPLGVRRLAALLTSQARSLGAGILLITHDLTLAAGASDQILFLDTAAKRLVPVFADWPGPAELTPPDERHQRLGRLTARVEALLAGASAAPPAFRRQRAELGLARPLVVLGASLVGALRPRLFFPSARVGAKLLGAALLRPLAFFATVGGLLGFTVPFVIASLSAALAPGAILGMVGGSYILSLAPPISAIVFSATSGSSVNAWLGGQTLNGQVLALEGLGVPPERYLWSPAWLALCASYLGAAAVFIASMVVGGWALFRAYDVPHALLRLLSNFVDPAPGQLVPVIRMSCLIALYAVALPSITVARAVEPKRSSDDVTSAMTSAVMRCTLFVVAMELLSTLVQRGVIE
ncbi:MAG: ATP-binding cassette domain-containing protein [Polyangiaceae bacterium]|nr:ATP-binding cassette domain-containing protein [Polyangiaceae bacterium]